jgi:sucrose-6-phosphatase
VSRDDDWNPPKPSPNGGGWLLVTDVDGTLIGDSAALGELLDAVDGRVLVVLSSSRPVASVHRTLQEFPGGWEPHGIVGALGTEVEIEGRSDDSWRRRFSGWDRAPVDEVMRRLGYEPHAAEFQTPVKASFSVPRSDRAMVRRALDDAGIVGAIFTSGVSDFDVLAPGAGKGSAARHVAERLGFPEDRVATAGDALIDVDMLGFGHGILVGNATEEALEAVAGGPVYRAAAPYAAGVLEGLRAVGALPVESRR